MENQEELKEQSDEQVVKKTYPFDRYLAKGLDMIILSLLAVVLQFVWYPLAAVVVILYALYHDALNKGRSPGKRIIGLAVKRLDTNDIITWRESFLRNLSFGIFATFAVIPIIGWILMFLIGIPLLIFEAYLIYSLESGYRLGDVIAKTKVVSSNK